MVVTARVEMGRVAVESWAGLRRGSTGLAAVAVERAVAEEEAVEVAAAWERAVATASLEAGVAVARALAAKVVVLEAVRGEAGDAGWAAREKEAAVVRDAEGDAV